jgi:DNA (cytosine-5)-methyltransferase 1
MEVLVKILALKEEEQVEMNGSGTRSSLMYETLRIVENLKPKYVIWENVKNILSKKHIHNFENYIIRMLNMKYISFYQVLNSKDYGIPQNRERVFTISIRKDILHKKFEFPEKQILKLKLNDLLESNVDKKYFISEKMKNGRLVSKFTQYNLVNSIINGLEVHSSILARYNGAPSLLITNNTKLGFQIANPRRWNRFGTY